MSNSPVDKLTKSAIRYLSYRQRSNLEIRDYLGRKYTSDDQDTIIDEVISKLEDFNLLNDEQFATQWAESRLNKGKGPIIIRIELKRKGIDEHLIQSTIEELNSDLLYQSASKQLSKYSRKLNGLQKHQQKAKAYRYLYSRGFETNTINPVIDDMVMGKVK